MNGWLGPEDRTNVWQLPPGPHGQEHWAASYPECGSDAQSPIDIQTDSVTVAPELPIPQPHGYEQPGTEPLDLRNNGHTGKTQAAGTCGRCFKPPESGERDWSI